MNRIILLHGFSMSFIVLSICMFAGCSQSGQSRFSVSGTVKIDGVPLKTGFISFRTSDPDASEIASGSGAITEGQYQLKKRPGLPEGQYIVKIIATEEIPGKTKKVKTSFAGITEEEPVTRNLIPDDYGEQSKQIVTIHNKNNVIDFNIPAQRK